MLREIQHVKQERKKDRRRWFTDDYWDLYVWSREDGTYSGFQLCYGKPVDEHALTWMDENGPVHTGVSETSPGRSGAGNMEASILVADGIFDVGGVAQRFWKESGEIDSNVRQYVIVKMKELMAPGAPPVQ